MAFISVVCAQCGFQARQTKLTFDAGKILACPLCSGDKGQVLLQKTERGVYGKRRDLKDIILRFMKQNVGVEFTPAEIAEGIECNDHSDEVVKKTIISMARPFSKRQSLISLRRNHYTLLCDASVERRDYYRDNAIGFLKARPNEPFTAMQISAGSGVTVDEVQYISRALNDAKKALPELRFHSKESAGLPCWSWQKES